MSNEEIYNLLRKTPVRTDAIPLIEYILEHEKHACLVYDAIFRYGIIVGKQEERKKRNGKKTSGKKLGEYVTSVANDLTENQYVAICNVLGVSLDAFC